MPFFRPRLVTMPDGTTLSYGELRERERLDTRRRAAAVRKAEAAADLDTTRRRDAYRTETAQRARDARTNRRVAAGRALGRALRGVSATLATNRPLIAAVAMAGLCVTATVSGQIMVYTSLTWHGWSWLAYVLPGIVEGASWTSAINASWLASRPTPLAYQKHIRLMWCYATYAAGSNGYHFAITLHDPVTGVLLGAASIVGPATWHRYITLTTTHRANRTAEEVLRAVGRRVFHPFLSLRAVSLWSAADGVMSRSMAWRLTWERTHGGPPGFGPVTAVTPARNHRLFRWVFGTITPPTAATSVTPTATLRTPGAADAQPLLADTATPPAAWADQVAACLDEWRNARDRRPPAAAVAVATARPTGQRPSSPGVAQPGATPTDTRDIRGDTAPGTPTAVPAHPDSTGADRVRQYYRDQRALGVPPDKIRPVDAAGIAGLSRQRASEVLREMKIREPAS